jgi:hypothetical protein
MPLREAFEKLVKAQKHVVLAPFTAGKLPWPGGPRVGKPQPPQGADFAGGLAIGSGLKHWSPAIVLYNAANVDDSSFQYPAGTLLNIGNVRYLIQYNAGGEQNVVGGMPGAAWYWKYAPYDAYWMRWDGSIGPRSD